MQCVVAALTVIVAARLIRPAFDHDAFARLAIDVWMPLGLVVPFLGCAFGVNGSLEDLGRITLAVPMTLGIAGCGLACFSAARPGMLIGARAVWAVLGVGVFVVLLGAAHTLTVWSGQASFAIGAVLLWMATPDGSDLVRADAANGSALPSLGLILLVGCGIAQAMIFTMAPDQAWWPRWVMPAVGGLVVIATVSRFGRHAALRLSTGVIVFGVLFGLGTIALTGLIRRIRGGDLGPAGDTDLAFGFGILAPEAAAVLATGLLLMLIDRCSTPWRRGFGAALSLLAVILATRLILASVTSESHREKNQDNAAEVSMLDLREDRHMVIAGGDAPA